jgi:hypothetical protein
LEISGSDLAGVEDETPEPVVDSAEVKIPVEPMGVPEPTAAPVEPLNNPPAEQPVETPGLQRSSSMKFVPPRLVPSFKGNHYSYAVTQLQSRVLHPDLHMRFMQHMCDEAPDVVADILTQLSMKAGLKAVFDEMKQLHFRKTFLSKHWNKLTKSRRPEFWKRISFLSRNQTGQSREGQSMEEINSGTTFRRKLRVHQRPLQSHCC